MILDIEGSCCGVNAALGSGVSGRFSRSLVWDWWILDPSIRAALLQLLWRCLDLFIKLTAHGSGNRTRFG
jgi:hypothetical protein